MHRDGDASTAGLAALVAMALSAATPALPQDLASASLDARDEREAFLSTAQVVTAAPADGRPSWRASLRSGARTHDASVETADGSGPTRRDHRLNVAAYELDKLLGLRLVPPSVARLVDGRPASVTWWVDDLAMDELTRRKRGVAPRDPDAWTRQMQAVRVFDELISNTYRDTSPPLYLNSVWDNLLITTDWTVWLVDHTGAFRTRATLNDVESLTGCPRTVLEQLRALTRERLLKALGRYLSRQQIDALDARRVLLVRHFDAAIAARGAAAVLYDLPARR